MNSSIYTVCIVQYTYRTYDHTQCGAVSLNYTGNDTITGAVNPAINTGIYI